MYIVVVRNNKLPLRLLNKTSHDGSHLVEHTFIVALGRNFPKCFKCGNFFHLYGGVFTASSFSDSFKDRK